MDLVVASCNIRNGFALDGRNAWPFRVGKTATAIADLDADIIGLQEVYGFQRRCLTRRLPAYEFVGDGRGHGRGEQCCIASRLPIAAHTTRWFDVPGARFPRIATTATIGPLQFTSLHLDEASADRRRCSVAQLVSWLDPTKPQVIVGDFNAGPSETATFTPLRDAGYVPAPIEGGTFHGFDGRRDGPQIDHIVVGPGIDVLDAGVAYGDQRASDHWPVVARVRVSR